MQRAIDRVSVHGGHSGEFCGHARDTLGEVVAEYHTQGFAWVGITEHMPPPDDTHVTADETERGLDAAGLQERFAAYFKRCRELQAEYAERMPILVAFETEMFVAGPAVVQRLIREFEPDYVVGSVHHVNGIWIDSGEELYAQAVESAGGLDELYCAYFDTQLELIDAVHPAVIGHFDLVRMHDPDYRARIERPEVWRSICRNLERIRELDLILDLNVRAFEKGASEAYVSEPILQHAHKLGIAAVPGDDSHGVAGVGRNLERGEELLRDFGFDTDWRVPGRGPRNPA